MLKVNKLSFITETGHLINIENYDINKKGYMLLAAIQNEQILRNDPTTLSRDDILIAKNTLENKLKVQKRTIILVPLTILMVLDSVLSMHQIIKPSIKLIVLQKVSAFQYIFYLFDIYSINLNMFYLVS